MRLGGVFGVGCSVACLVVAVAPAGDVRAAAAEGLGSGGPVLLLTWVDLCSMPPDLRAGAEREMQALLEPAGVAVAARTASAGEIEPTGGALVVLLATDQRRREPRPAGSARPDTDSHATAWVFPANVARAVDLRWDRRELWSVRERALFARGLGAVAVHELAHLYAGAHHRPKGLMSDRLRLGWLLDSGRALDADLRAAFRQGVAEQGRVPELAADTRMASKK